MRLKAILVAWVEGTKWRVLNGKWSPYEIVVMESNTTRDLLERRKDTTHDYKTSHEKTSLPPHWYPPPIFAFCDIFFCKKIWWVHQSGMTGVFVTSASNFFLRTSMQSITRMGQKKLIWATNFAKMLNSTKFKCLSLNFPPVWMWNQDCRFQELIASLYPKINFVCVKKLFFRKWSKNEAVHIWKKKCSKLSLDFPFVSSRRPKTLKERSIAVTRVVDTWNKISWWYSAPRSRRRSQQT